MGGGGRHYLHHHPKLAARYHHTGHFTERPGLALLQEREMHPLNPVNPSVFSASYLIFILFAIISSKKAFRKSFLTYFPPVICFAWAKTKIVQKYLRDSKINKMQMLLVLHLPSGMPIKIVLEWYSDSSENGCVWLNVRHHYNTFLATLLLSPRGWFHKKFIFNYWTDTCL